MRRLASFLLVAVLAAPAGAFRRSSVTDMEKARCAIECGHAEGAACCPLSEASDGRPAFKRCPRDAPASLVASLPPVLLVSIDRLRPPAPARRLEPPSSEAPVSVSLRPPDHVPLPVS